MDIKTFSSIPDREVIDSYGHTMSEEGKKKLSESLKLSWAKRKGLKNGSTRVFD